MLATILALVHAEHERKAAGSVPTTAAQLLRLVLLLQ